MEDLDNRTPCRSFLSPEFERTRTPVFHYANNSPIVGNFSPCSVDVSGENCALWESQEKEQDLLPRQLFGEFIRNQQFSDAMRKGDQLSSNMATPHESVTSDDDHDSDAALPRQDETEITEFSSKFNDQLIISDPTLLSSITEQPTSDTTTGDDNDTSEVENLESVLQETIDNTKSSSFLEPSSIIRPYIAVISDWALRFITSTRSPVKFPLNVSVEGIRKGPQDQFHTSIICKRVSALEVETSSGNVYKLKGCIDAQATLQNGFPKEIVMAFKNGFPTNWKEKLIKHCVTEDVIETSPKKIVIPQPLKARNGRSLRPNLSKLAAQAAVKTSVSKSSKDITQQPENEPEPEIPVIAPTKRKASKTPVATRSSASRMRTRSKTMEVSESEESDFEPEDEEEDVLPVIKKATKTKQQQQPQKPRTNQQRKKEVPTKKQKTQSKTPKAKVEELPPPQEDEINSDIDEDEFEKNFIPKIKPKTQKVVRSKSSKASSRKTANPKPSDSNTIENQEEGEIPWTRKESEILAEAVKTFSPTRKSFWFDVSQQVGRTASECQAKYQSKFRTPKNSEKRRKRIISPLKLKNGKLFHNTAKDMEKIRVFQKKAQSAHRDDIFDLSPMKGVEDRVLDDLIEFPSDDEDIPSAAVVEETDSNLENPNSPNELLRKFGDAEMRDMFLYKKNLIERQKKAAMNVASTSIAERRKIAKDFVPFQSLKDRKPNLAMATVPSSFLNRDIVQAAHELSKINKQTEFDSDDEADYYFTDDDEEDAIVE